METKNKTSSNIERLKQIDRIIDEQLDITETLCVQAILYELDKLPPIKDIKKEPYRSRLKNSITDHESINVISKRKLIMDLADRSPILSTENEISLFIKHNGKHEFISQYELDSHKVADICHISEFKTIKTSQGEIDPSQIVELAGLDVSKLSIVKNGDTDRLADIQWLEEEYAKYDGRILPIIEKLDVPYTTVDTLIETYGIDDRPDQAWRDEPGIKPWGRERYFDTSLAHVRGMLGSENITRTDVEKLLDLQESEKHDRSTACTTGDVDKLESEEWLREHHVEIGMSPSRIADVLNVAVYKVEEAIENHNIDRQRYLSKGEQIVYEYVESLYGETYKIVPHEYPGWLDGLELDIQIKAPGEDIPVVGIEYQGRQHSEPVDHFGGEAGFEEQRERDQRKKELCKEWGVPLVKFWHDETLCKNLIESKLDDIISAHRPGS